MGTDPALVSSHPKPGAQPKFSHRDLGKNERLPPLLYPSRGMKPSFGSGHAKQENS